MAIVTGMTAEKITAITDDAVVSGSIDSATGSLTLLTRGNETISVGSIDTERGVLDAVARVYPVGSIFISAISTNPADQLGVGTWEAWGTGRVPVGVDPTQTEFDTAEKTGGEKKHTLTSTEVPRHSHTMAHSHTASTNGAHRHTIQFTSDPGNGIASVPKGSNTPNAGAFVDPIDESGDHSHTISGSSATTTGLSGGNTDGSTQAHNNLQPFITCYMWKRTA